MFATPAWVALMEHAACEALAGTLDEGITTVGTYMAVEHTAASPVGMLGGQRLCWKRRMAAIMNSPSRLLTSAARLERANTSA